MPLSAHPTPPSSPEQAWTAAYEFVARCRQWAVEELARRAENGKPRAEWEAYLKFTDHTLRELEEGTLDHWFHPPEPAADAPD